MSVTPKPLEKFDRLERRTQELLDVADSRCACFSINLLELINELRIYHLELEIQNEELKRAQQELADLYREYEALYEFAPCGYLNIDPKGCITRVNLAGTTLLKDTRAKLL